MKLPSTRPMPIIVPAIVFINIAIYILWTMTTVGSHESPFMTDHFLISWTSLYEGRLWTLLSSEFSHTLFWHLFLNMIVLTSFGPIVELRLGALRFFWFYITACLVSSISHALVSAFILKTPDLPALGASGAIAGVVLLFALMFPREKILFFGLIPVPALAGALGFIGLDLWGLMAQAEGGGLPIGHGAHLGGAVTGLIYYFLFLRRRANLKWN